MIKDLPLETVKGSKDIEITGICIDSRRAKPGDLFIARRGENYDGAEFIPSAIASGVSAVITDLYDPSFANITQIIHPHPEEFAVILSKRCYLDPSKDLFLIGITGTNGKTTTAYLIQHLLQKAQEPTGLISTVETIIGTTRFENSHTTLDVIQNHQLLREMHVRGCKSAVMEVTSHGLAQKRVDELSFDCAIFTNLTPEHLDYHHTMEEYAGQKKKLFLQLEQSVKEKKCAIFNVDSPWSAFFREGLTLAQLTYGINHPADILASDITLTPSSTAFTLSIFEKQFAVKTPLIGRFNIYNTLAAVACAVFRGVKEEKIVSALQNLPNVAGRLEKVENNAGIDVFVDFSHTEDSLYHALSTLQELGAKRIFTVFGCGGNRDQEKRPHMAKVAEKFSHRIWVTNDNPRKEDPQKIAEEIVRGFSKSAPYLVQLDRKLAIEEAIEEAKEGDIVLIAGKGHEQKQIFAHSTERFDDRQEAQNALKKRCTFC